MKRVVISLLAGASALAVTSHATAAAAAAQPTAAPAEEATLGEIVVTARRRSESLQEVPQTVNAVSSESLQKLAITQFSDIQTVVPGLVLNQNNTGFTADASLRGVTFSGLTGAEPTVAQYINDAPVSAVETFQSMFDLGQIEVLKGPQGTTRGIAAPSGAITITTRKPSLSEFGGYIDGTFNDQHGRNVNGALNIPIVKDVLAMRFAATVDTNDFDGVRSINNSLRPRQNTTGERVSVSFEPSEVFNANVMYQHLDRDQLGYNPVAGPGHGLASAPPLTPEDRASVNDEPTTFRQHSDIVVAQIDSRIFGQHLSYVGSYHNFKINQAAAGDSGDVLPGIETFQYTRTSAEQTSQEIRLASDPAPGRWFDYTVGAFYNWQNSPVFVVQPGQLQSGAFGRPPGGVTNPDLSLYNPAYQIATQIAGTSFAQETSFFGSGTLHLPWNTELSAGVRHIAASSKGLLQIQLAGGRIALGPTNDLTLPAGLVVANYPSRYSNRPTIYNVSLSHRVTRDFLVYANTGSSWRAPVTSIGLQGGIVGSSNTAVNDLTFHPPEKSKAYEVGFKSTWMDGRARLNASLFRQKFTNLTTLVPGINYLNSSTNQVGNFDMTASVDATIEGFDIDAAFQITPDWSISAQTSYAHGKVTGTGLPCNTFGPNGVTPTFNTGDATNPGLVSFCPGGSPSRLPLWNLSAQSEYSHPVADGMDGFLRGLLNYTPQNKYIRPNFAADSYSLLNVYAGVRAHDGAWEISLYAKNAFNNETELDHGQVDYNLNGSLGSTFPSLNVPSGYALTKMTPRREVGIHVHYALGSR
jgi:iron complex outermembrane receptor protein